VTVEEKDLQPKEKERRKRGGRGASDTRKESDLFESVIQIRRCAAVVKGGRRFSFNALVVVGDRHGKVAYGYAKATEVPPAVDKAVKMAHRRMRQIPLKGTTLPHRTIGRFGSTRVVMLPAAPGTGVIAGRGVREVLVGCGVADVLTKCMGSTNPLNVVRATLAGLSKMRTKEQVATLRGVTV
jgi:small subunit ribosomal protein S5